MDRKFVVKYLNHFTSTFLISSGVPQSSVLATLHYLHGRSIHVIDITTATFADTALLVSDSDPHNASELL